MSFHKLLIISIFSLLIRPGVSPKTTIGNLYIISVGINETGAYAYDFKYCAKDAAEFVEKIKSDLKLQQENLAHYKETQNKAKLLEHYRNSKKTIKKIHSYLLVNEKATKENIRNAFKDVIKNARPEDEFIFTYSGVSVQTVKGRTFLLCHTLVLMQKL